MALTISGIPDCRAMLGQSQWLRAYQLKPGSSDYTTGGYAINASSVDMTYLFGAWQIACNAAATLYMVQFVLAAGAFSGTDPAPQTSIKMQVLIPLYSGTGSFIEVANGANLSSLYWWVEFLGY